MTNICVGDTIRHIKRDSRYRIEMRVKAPSELSDDERYIMCMSEQDRAHGRPYSFFAPEVLAAGDPVDPWVFRRLVMVQRSTEADHAEAQEDWLLYTSLERPGEAFLRPLREFTDDRFEREAPLPRQLQFLTELMPRELVTLVIEGMAIEYGAPLAETGLAALAEENSEFLKGDLSEQVALISAAARRLLGGAGAICLPLSVKGNTNLFLRYCGGTRSAPEPVLRSLIDDLYLAVSRWD